jgi:hypothetical protein
MQMVHWDIGCVGYQRYWLNIHLGSNVHVRATQVGGRRHKLQCLREVWVGE